MKTSSTIQCMLRMPVFAALLPLCFLLLAIRATRADSATWSANPPEDLWGDSTDWTPQIEPYGSDGVATFATSTVTSVYLLSDDGFTPIGELDYSAGGDAFTIVIDGVELSIEGAGIVNESGLTQNFMVEGGPDGGYIAFSGEASAGSSTFFNIEGGATNNDGDIGFAQFYDSSSAGSGSFTVGGGVGKNKNGAVAFFYDTSSMGAANFTAGGGSATGNGAKVTFFNSANAGQGTLVVNGGAAGSTGSTASFQDTSTGGTARLEVFGNGTLDVSGRVLPGVTIGSLEGDGLVTLGANNLSVGANKLSTTFAGVISGTGSLTKIGSGKLTLSGANTYTGPTRVRQGRLFIQDSTGELTVIPGSITVDGGTFGGSGLVGGAVVIGDSSGRPASLEPNQLRGGTFIIQKSLTFNSSATCNVDFNSSASKYSFVSANRVTIKAGALFTISDHGNASFGAVNLPIINNTGTMPISGEFANLPEGGSITVGQNTFYATYHGGDGNDFFLTTVP